VPSDLATMEPLPTDPALISGRLDNGVAYVVRRHPNPPGRVGIWLHVASGSLNETDDTRGLAHYLEHMAFNGSANFPPGTLIPFFQSLGMTFGRDQNAFTSLDQTVYTLSLPDTKTETLERGLTYMSDVAFRLSLLPREIDLERAVVLEEKRARAGARQRARDAVLERLAPGSTLGRRLPIGTEAAIQAITPAQMQEYYRRWYVPSNMTVIAVGDADPAALVRAIGQHFGTAAAAPRPDPRPVGVEATAGLRAIVFTDPELAQAEVGFTRVEPPRAPLTTVAAYRRFLIDQVAAWILDRRLEISLAEGRGAFSRASVSISQWSGALRVASAQVTTAPERWRPALHDLATEIARARLHGVTPGELEEARVAFLASAEEAGQREGTRPAREVLREINDAVNRREPPLSAAQRLALYRRLLPAVTSAEVTRALGAAFDAGGLIAVVTMPPRPDAPGEDDLIALGRTALAVRPDPPTDRARPTALLAAPPRPGAVVESGEHAATGVWSGWLDNGVRVHHRRVEQRRNEVTVTIALAGGAIEETADDRGITAAALRAWDRPATGTLSSTAIRTLMTGKSVRVGTDHGLDWVGLSVTAQAPALVPGLELAHALLTDPVLEPVAWEQWREQTLQEIAARAVEPRGVLAEAEADALYPPGEVRLRPLTPAQVRALSRERAQAWLRRLVATAPIEVAVVGDLDREAALALVTRYLGSLPARERIGLATLKGRREVTRRSGPIKATRTVATQTDQAQVRSGFFGPDVQDVRETRLLILAARVLSTRMNAVIREERGLVYSIGAGVRPGEVYPGLGVLAAQAPTDPVKAAPLATALDEMFAAFAASGPTDAELAVAKSQLRLFVEEAVKGPDFWIDRLARIDYRGLSLDDVARLAADYESFTPAQVREAFARHATPGARFELVVLPRRP
jgi:zinc protease